MARVKYKFKKLDAVFATGFITRRYVVDGVPTYDVCGDDWLDTIPEPELIVQLRKYHQKCLKESAAWLIRLC